MDRIAVCTGSCGPGHIHLLNSVYNANRAHVPLLAIAYTINTNEFGTDYFQEASTIKLFGDCNIYNQISTIA
ncbi:thiamine pyrophosphate-binding protein [Chryseobacterium sp. TY3]